MVGAPEVIGLVLLLVGLVSWVWLRWLGPRSREDPNFGSRPTRRDVGLVWKRLRRWKAQTKAKLRRHGVLPYIVYLLASSWRTSTTITTTTTLSTQQPSSSSSRRRRRVIRGRLTGSYFAAAVGIHPYKSRNQLLEELSEPTASYDDQKPPPTTNDELIQQKSMEWGNKHEAVALDVYRALSTDNLIIQPNNITFTHPKYPWIGGKPDALIKNHQGRIVGVVEVKCPTPFRRDGSKGVAVPHQTVSSFFYYIPQCQAYMEIMGVEYCDFMSFTLEGSRIFRLSRDRDYWAAMLEVLADFHLHLLRRSWEDIRDTVDYVEPYDTDEDEDSLYNSSSEISLLLDTHPLSETILNKSYATPEVAPFEFDFQFDDLF